MDKRIIAPHTIVASCPFCSARPQQTRYTVDYERAEKYYSCDVCALEWEAEQQHTITNITHFALLLIKGEA